MSEGLNVLGGSLEGCSFDPVTGFWRDGSCRTGGQDVGVHAVCAVMTDEFLRFSASVGNDLSTPHPEWGFPGLQPGDRWCLCAARWQEALEAGCTRLVTETGELRDDGPGNSYRNILRYGFEERFVVGHRLRRRAAGQSTAA